jgi:cyclic pyranopterin phosphate synthase
MPAHVFSFEEPNEGLVWIPLAARRALDHAGVKLSLDAWQALALEDRLSLTAAGAGAVVEKGAVEALLSRAEPAPERITPRPDPEAIPDELAGLVGERAAELAAAWPRLSPLERYALAKLTGGSRAQPGDRNARLRAACDALLAPQKPVLTHLTESGDAHMVDVSEKKVSRREASAQSFLSMRPETLAALKSGNTPKGDVLAVARVAGIQAAKRTPELIPLCHAIALTGVDVELTPEAAGVRIVATARAFDRTGVEMEALVAASVAALALYDMLKALDREMTIGEVTLLKKSGGRSGDYERGAR